MENKMSILNLPKVEDMIQKDWINHNREILSLTQINMKIFNELKVNLRTSKYDNWQCKNLKQNLEATIDYCKRLAEKIEQYQST